MSVLVDEKITDWQVELKGGFAKLTFQLSSGNFAEVSLNAEQALYLSWALVRFGADSLKKLTETTSMT